MDILNSVSVKINHMLNGLLKWKVIMLLNGNTSKEIIMRFKHRKDGHYEIFIFPNKKELKTFLYKCYITKIYIEREQIND